MQPNAKYNIYQFHLLQSSFFSDYFVVFIFFFSLSTACAQLPTYTCAWNGIHTHHNQCQCRTQCNGSPPAHTYSCTQRAFHKKTTHKTWCHQSIHNAFLRIRPLCNGKTMHVSMYWWFFKCAYACMYSCMCLNVLEENNSIRN